MRDPDGTSSDILCRIFFSSCTCGRRRRSLSKIGGLGSIESERSRTLTLTGGTLWKSMASSAPGYWAVVMPRPWLSYVVVRLASARAASPPISILPRPRLSVARRHLTLLVYVPVAPGFPIGHMICSRLNCDCVGHKCVNIEFANFTIQRLTLLLLLKDIVGDN